MRILIVLIIFTSCNNRPSEATKQAEKIYLEAKAKRLALEDSLFIMENKIR